MPNIDVNTCFFTAIVPVCNEGIVERDGMRSSPIHVVREVLETLPTALQSGATEEIGLNSPFARNFRTHFLRFVVLDQPHFNGRDYGNVLLNLQTDLVAARPVDQLPCPYLLVMIDFDLTAEHGADNEPRRYLEELWSNDEIAAALKSVFQYCYTFEKVGDAASFADLMLKCQVETTMPFHDYWYVPPKLASISTATLIAPSLIGVALALLAGAMEKIPWPWAVGLAVLLLILGVLLDYWLVMRKGAQPFPAAPGTSLPHVLKALYLQQAFTRFAIAQQHRDPADLGGAFRQFLEATRPDDLQNPTQPPGVIRSGDAA